jgi:hypothetical protein
MELSEESWDKIRTRISGLEHGSIEIVLGQNKGHVDLVVHDRERLEVAEATKAAPVSTGRRYA